MKYELVLYTDTSAMNDLPRRALSLELVGLLKALRSCEGVLELNAGAWLFDLERSREIYDQVLSEAERAGVQMISLELPDGVVRRMVPVRGGPTELERSVGAFFYSKT